MKKFILIVALCLLTSVLMTGCSENEGVVNTASGTTSTTSQVLEDKTTGSTTGTEQVNQKTAQSFGSANSLDVDLTGDNTLMSYTKLTEIFNDSENYIGKVMKVPGTFSVYRDEVTNTFYYYVLVTDATACCQAGIEFTFTDGFDPTTVLAETDPVVITGVFTTYEENGKKYARLIV